MPNIQCPTCAAKGDNDDQTILEVNPKLYVTLEVDESGEVVAIVSGIEYEDYTVACAHSEHVLRDEELDRKIGAELARLEGQIMEARSR